MKPVSCTSNKNMNVTTQSLLGSENQIGSFILNNMTAYRYIHKGLLKNNTFVSTTLNYSCIPPKIKLLLECKNVMIKFFF